MNEDEKQQEEQTLGNQLADTGKAYRGKNGKRSSKKGWKKGYCCK